MSTRDPLTVRWDRTVIHPDTDPGDDTIVCCLAGDSRPVALLLDDEHREALAAALLESGDEPTQPAPDFFQPGHTYAHRDGSTFRCDVVTTHPESGWRVALGWHTDTADWTFVAVRHIDHWRYEYDRGTPTETSPAYASTRGEPGGDA
jgi:hypothetical protein